MISIVEPKKHIADLWSSPDIGLGEPVRLMRYVMRVDCDDKVLLHNTVTGQLVALDREEECCLEPPSIKSSSVLEQLIAGHYLVRLDFDEHEQVKKMRYILRKLDAVKPKYITQYRILPTTACNARCYYCFEQGVRISTMSERTAAEVVDYIVRNCGPDKKVTIMWFGGEPTVASERIDQICKGLLDNNINYISAMTTNGYLLDENMVDRAKNLWHLTRVQITVDGTEKNYNEIKAYVNAAGSPYKKVLNNIGLLLEHEINVGLRMNFDVGTYRDFEDLVDEVNIRFQKNPRLHIYAYPVVGEFACDGKKLLHGDDGWFAEKSLELNAYARRVGIAKLRKELPFMRHIGCEADCDNAITINPEGQLARCGEQFEESQSVGNVRLGFTDMSLWSSWKELAEYQKCIDCIFYPACMRLLKCSAEDRCFFQNRNYQYVIYAQQLYNKGLKKEKSKEENGYAFEGAPN